MKNYIACYMINLLWKSGSTFVCEKYKPFLTTFKRNAKNAAQ